MFGIRKLFRKRMAERELESQIQKNLDLTYDTSVLQENLKKLRADSERGCSDVFSGWKADYLYRRLREKANLIRESYTDGSYNYIAVDFEKTAIKVMLKKDNKIVAELANDFWKMEFDYV